MTWKYDEKLEVYTTEKDGVGICVYWQNDKYYVDIFYSNSICCIGPYDTLEEAKFAGEKERDFQY